MKDAIQIPIIKASGMEVFFSPEKLQSSLTRSGASPEQVKQILNKVQEHLYPGMKTKEIYKKAYKLLKKLNKPLAARYKLKAAIMELGPSGFPFEQYLASILHAQGYDTKTGILVDGKCVTHEVDVIAQKGEHHFMIECKFHNRPGSVCDVKIPLYIHSRFKDVEASWVHLPGHEIKLHQGWVVTNTRFTSDAIKYGQCAGLYLLGWQYPQENSLNSQIERLGFYPITCLSTLKKDEKRWLLGKNIVLCKELCHNTEILTLAGLNTERIKQVQEEGNVLCQKLITNGKH